MSASDTQAGEDDPAEPVDAEFEPAPDGDGPNEAPSDKQKSGAGWFKVSLFVIAAAAIGGGAGWLIGQVTPPQIFDPNIETGDFEARLSALETAEAAVDRGDLDALQARIAALEEAQNASGLRADAVEQLVRDVADLRGRIEALEDRPAGDGAPAPGSVSGSGGVDADALAGLERQLAEAIERLETRLTGVEDVAASARTASNEARSAARQALDAAAAPADSQAQMTAPSAELAELRAEIASLAGAQADLQDRLSGLDRLAARLDSLEGRAARADALAELAGEVADLKAELTRLEQAAARSAGAAEGQRSLAERALSYARLSEAASRSEPFAAEHAELARLWPDAPQLGAIEGLALTGAARLEDLADQFPADSVRAATGETETFFGVLRIRRDGEDGPAAAIETALADGDLPAALEIVDGLEGEAAAAAAAWRAQAQDRVRLETALDAMAAALRAQQEGAE